MRSVVTHAVVAAGGFVGGVAWASWQGLDEDAGGTDDELERITELKQENAELKTVLASVREAFKNVWEMDDYE